MEDQEIDFTAVVERIKSVMNEHNLSPKSFADKVGENPSKISHLFSGRNNPSLSFIMRICQAFPDVTANWLLGYETEKNASPLDNANGTIVFPPSEPQLAPVNTNGTQNFSSSDVNPSPIENESIEKTPNGAQAISQGAAKTIKKIIILYSDCSFEEYAK